MLGNKGPYRVQIRMQLWVAKLEWTNVVRSQIRPDYSIWVKMDKLDIINSTTHLN